MRSTINNLLSVALVLIGLIGCSLDTERTQNPPPHSIEPLLCETDSDCDVYDRNCQHGLCVDGPKDAFVRLSATILPPPDRSALSQQSIRDVATDLVEPITISLQRNVSVVGTISQRGKPSPGRVQMFFSRNGDVPGRRFTNNTTSDDQGRFDVQLPKGEYSVSLRTESEAFPEHNTTLRVNEKTEGSMVHFELPPETDFVRWTGRLVRLDENHVTHAVPSVTLWAQDTESSMRSSMAVNDENGVFSFYMSRSVKSFQIQIRSRVIEDNGQHYAIPSSTFPPIRAEYEVGDADEMPDAPPPQQIPGYELVIGQLKPSVKVTGMVVDSDAHPVVGARVLAQTRIPSGDLEFEDASPTRSALEQVAISDEDGTFEFLFPPYPEVSITAFDNQLGPRLSDPHRTVDLISAESNDISGIELIVRQSMRVDFDVRDAAGQPVDYFDATFELQDSAELSARNYDARSEELGGSHAVRPDSPNAVRVPEGQWNVTIAPRVDLTLPKFRFVQHLTRESPTVEATLPLGIAAAFHIEDDLGERVRGATVELWLETKDDAGRLSSRMLGSAQSDADGRATVLIPYLPHEQ